MKDPLRKRFPREVRHEFGKYFMILVLLVTTIGFVSGFLVADGSMITAYKDSFETYNIENGNFLTSEELSAEQKEEIEKQGIRLYDNFYVERELDNGSTIRIFKNREEVNRVCLMKGEMPKQAGEIVLDRMFADNNGFHVGDTIRSGDDAWQVTGVVALSDYSALFSDNNDMMFDSILFGVAVVDGDGFEELGSVHRFWSYSWKYDNEPKDDIEEKEASDDLLKEIGKIAPLEAFVPRYINQSIQFTGDDMGNDRAMMMVLLYIVIVILAFVFGITTLNTIAKESAVIGTLRASGYTRGELVRHYMAVPVTVTFVGAVIGNVLGYTVMKKVVIGMYYNSYSLPTYKTYWTPDAFVKTTVVPVIIMFVINLFVIVRMMRFSPLRPAIREALS